jgi:hypothetical protein
MAPSKQGPILTAIAWHMPGDEALRKELVDLLTGGNAHASFADTVDTFPVDHAGDRPGGSPHTAWELLEHVRIGQEDIVKFSSGPDYVEMKWPDDYWPREAAPKNPAEWTNSVAAMRKDLERFVQMIQDPKKDLHEPFAWGKGQTLLREALVLADHNSYHLGQLMLLRRSLEASH